MPDIVTPFHPTIVLEEFQRRIVERMSARLRHESRPLLLRSPTGSGKTLMIGRILDRTIEAVPAVWFWFAPYSNILAQTRNTLLDHCLKLHPFDLGSERTYDHRPGDVLLSTAQLVSKAHDTTQIFTQRKDAIPTLAVVVARARAAGHMIGVVIDEAHIGVSSDTEFAKFIKWLKPDRAILATATPKDKKITSFLPVGGYTDYETFSVSRDDVVDVALNKRYIAAFIYQMTEASQSLADLKKTVLKRAWEKHVALRQKLRDLGIPTVPLMLVQVANGEDSVKEAVDYLVRDCGISVALIATYESGDADPGKLTALAHDPTREVLVFKEAAGTGFDAPRAFVLTSTKSVADVDFATQFIGRIMRVDRHMRAWMRIRPGSVDPDLDTAYVYLADARVKSGFETAVQQLKDVKTNLEGCVEKLGEIILPSGRRVLTNRPTNQPSFVMRDRIEDCPYTFTVSEDKDPFSASGSAADRESDGGTDEDRSGATVGGTGPTPPQGSFFDDEASLNSDELSRAPRKTPPRHHFLRQPFAGVDDLRRSCREHSIAVYPLRAGLDGFGGTFKTEVRPSVARMAEIITAVTRRLQIDISAVHRATSTALGNLRAVEVRKELVSLQETPEEIGIEIDRASLTAEVHRFVASLPQFESADEREFLRRMVDRVSVDANQFLNLLPIEARLQPEKCQRACRDATYLLIREMQVQIRELVNAELTAQVDIVDASPVPDAILFPEDILLKASTKSAYGITPPSSAQLEDVQSYLMIDERKAIQNTTVSFADGTCWRVDTFDGNWTMNEWEFSLVKALDKAPFVLWWTRNPHRKLYASGVLRSDSKDRFYPDFIVCVRYWPGDAESIRFLETKMDLADAAAKAKRAPHTYGTVVFLRFDQGRFVLVNKDGTLGKPLDRDLVDLRQILMTNS